MKKSCKKTEVRSRISGKCIKRCKPGQVRSQKTNRCTTRRRNTKRKTAQSKSKRPDTKRNFFRMYQCVTVNGYAGFIFGRTRGRYSVSVPSKNVSFVVDASSMRPRECSERLRRTIAEHKSMFRH